MKLAELKQMAVLTWWPMFNNAFLATTEQIQTTTILGGLKAHVF